MNNNHSIYLEDVTENNLKHLTLSIPKHCVNVFTGVSGSGKSSLVFDTIAAESQRQLNETYSAYLRNQMPQLPPPRAGRIEYLSPAIVISQKRLGGNYRSTVGTATDLQPLLRLVFSRAGKPYAGSAGSFSFNSPEGACPVCNGLGRSTTLREELLLDEEKSLNTGAILFPLFPVGSWYWRTYVLSGLFDNDKPVKEYTEEERRWLLYGKEGAQVDLPSKSGYFRFDYEGLCEKITRLFILRQQSQISERVKQKIAPFLTSGICPACGGSRYAQRILDCRINGYNLADWCKMEISQLRQVVQAVEEEKVSTVCAAIDARLEQMEKIGLGYLSLGRETSTLSGGESQRLKMVRHLNSSLSDLLYIFDEPSIGLHSQDLKAMRHLLRALCDKGNTVLVVEHNREIIEMADHLFEIGPGAGTNGGELLYEGDFAGLLKADTPTGRALREPIRLCEKEKTFSDGMLTVSAGGQNNLTPFTVSFPKGGFTVVAGVAGSGKSTLMRQVFLPAYPDAVLIDQSPIGLSPRSTPATYTKLFDEIRRLFARANGMSASMFSFNSEGACPTCHGLGYIYTDLAFMEPIRTRCTACGGHRYKPEVLACRLRGKTIDEVLNMTVDQALEFFVEKKLRAPLELLAETGLGYLTLGQPLTSLSGGECQRLKLASELQKKGGIYIMDEPTVGLHMSEVQRLLAIIRRLQSQNSTVIVIEHDLEMIAAADYLIELGPGSGAHGGRLIFEGSPAQLARRGDTPTGRCLAELLNR